MSNRLKVLEATCIVDGETRLQNIKHNLLLGLPVCEPYPKHDRKVAVVGAGPSAKRMLKEIDEFDGEVWAINGAHDWLIDNDVLPTAQVLLDPQPIVVEYARNPVKGVVYYVASICHPSVIEALDGYDVRIWNARIDSSMPPSGSYAIPGGTTCLTRAPFLAHMLGFRDIHIYGADSSFEETTHCYGSPAMQAGRERNEKQVRVGEKIFLTELKMMQQATDLSVIFEYFPGRLTLRSDGLVKALIESPMRDLQEVMQG